MKKVIVPVDFSDISKHAMNFAAEFCELIDGEILLLYVLEFPISQFSITKEANRQAMENFYTTKFIDSIQADLTSWEKALSEKGVKVRAALKYGNPFKKITRTIAEEEADYIVMGSKGVSGLKEFLLGSNAARMIRFAQCPVIIIKEETHVSEFNNVVLATDGTIEQDEIAQKAKALQSTLGNQLHLVKIKTPYNWLEDVQINQQLKNFAERNHLENFTASIENADFVDDGAVAFAEKKASGLIIIGTHGRTGLSHLLGGSTAETLVNESKIPVMVFKLDESH